MLIYFVRHGETDWNKVARLQGQRDVELNALGRVQAEEAGRRLATLVPDPAALDYVASPLERTRRTMEILRASLGLAPEAYRTDPRFMELTFGAWEGLTWREVRARDAKLAALRERTKWSFAPPGGGESYAMLSLRVLPAVAEISLPTLIVSHGGVARVLLAALAGVPEPQAAVVDIWQGRALVIESGRYAWA